MTFEELREWWSIALGEYPELRGWVLVLDRAVVRAGECRWSTGEIGISRWVLDAPEGEVLDTLLHEIAHVLAPHDHGHGPQWQTAAKRIGADPTPYYSEKMVACAPPPPYQIICPKCGVIGTRHRQAMDLAGRRHRACGTVGMYWGYSTHTGDAK